MFSNRQVGLMIQGPLRSKGVTGAGNVAVFDCVPSIIKLVDDYGDIFNEILVSTWSSEDEKALLLLRDRNIKVVTSEDPLGAEGSRIWSDNRERMYFSSEIGVRSMSLGIDYICRIRTDQTFNLRIFVEEFFKIISSFRDFETLGLPSTLHGLFIEGSRPFSMCDYAYIAHREVLEKFYESQRIFGDKAFTEDTDFPEGDSIRKFLFSLRSQFPFRYEAQFVPAIPKDLNYLSMPFGRVRVPASTVELWQTALTGVVSVSSERVLTSLHWRGEVVRRTNYPPNLMFLEHWRRARLNFLAYLEQTHPRIIVSNYSSLWFLVERLDSSGGGIVSWFLPRYRRLIRIIKKITSARPFPKRD